MANKWVQYFDKPMDGVWQQISQYSAQQVKKVLQFSKEDVLLDIGCSYGQITATLAPHVKRAYGVDVSGTNINIAKKKFAHNSK
ncbi:hypothetical protein RsTz2092_08390 [Deferribacterales bacterium RsTz2092]|nr:hypothetical protein AGMMS49941_13190 [Deferribacterales bacterium]